MSKRRRGPNPAQVRDGTARPVPVEAGGEPAGAGPPDGAVRPRLDIRRWPGVLLLCLAGGVLLLASFSPFDQWYLAYVALAAWGLAVVSARDGRCALACGFAAGVVFWAAGVYWLTWITPAGYLALVPYLAAYWLAAAWFLRRAARRRWPMWLALPVAWVALEYARGFALSGFPWFYLAHSQYANTRLIQVADLTGQYGVSFFVGMVNGAVIDLLTRRPREGAENRARLAPGMLVAPAACLAAAAGLLGYGSYRLSQHTMRPIGKVGLVQRAFPNSVVEREDGPSSQEILDAHFKTMRDLVGQGCRLVIAPESTLMDSDPEYWGALDPDESDPMTGQPTHTAEGREAIHLRQEELRRLADLVRDLGCPVLCGCIMPVPYGPPGERLYYNSALLYDLDRTGRLVVRERYAKVHLVPFGEYVPFRDDWPALHDWLRSFVPKSMPQLAPGERVVRFEVPGLSRAADEQAKPMRLAVPICYEGVFDRLCRSMVMQGGQKQVDMLANISNDGWFILSLPKGRRHASTELSQHLAQYVFRAVENRVPIVRAVNCGVSGLIGSDGRIVAVVDGGGAPAARIADGELAEGALVVEPLADSRVSAYSLTGDVFAGAVVLAALMGTVALLLRTGPRPPAEGKEA